MWNKYSPLCVRAPENFDSWQIYKEGKEHFLQSPKCG